MRLRALAALTLFPLLGGATAPACKPTASVELTIFHTNDLHSRLRASKNDPFGLGGLARIKTLLDRLRPTAANSLTLDAGDWSEGSWYFAVDAGQNMVRFLDQMGFDAACVGNHDFLAGPDALIAASRAASPRLSILAANFDARDFARRREFEEAVPPYTIREVNGIKVGIIGLSIASGFYDSYLVPVKIKDPVRAATDVAWELREKVDVMLIVSHNDFDLNRRLAREVPGVDAVISGHTHIKTPRAVIERNDGRDVPVVETGYWGKFVGELRLEMQPTGTLQPGPRLASFALHPVTPDIPEDPTIAGLVAEQDRILSARYGFDVNGVVGEADEELEQHDNTESTIGNLAAKSYRAATGAEIGMENATLTGIGIAPGPVTAMDLHDVIPHIYNPVTGKEWTVHVWNATGSDLEWLITSMFLVTGFAQSSAPLGWPVADGLDIVWTPILGKEALNVREILVNGKPLESGRRYSVALSDGLIRAIEVANRFMPHHFDLSTMVDTGLEAWQAVLRYGSVPGHLSIAHLRTGLHTKVSGQDLAVYAYGIRRDKGSLSVEVSNVGSKRSDQARLRCSSGLPDDLVDYGTDEQRWEKLGEARVPKLEPDTSVTLSIPWDTSALSGYWPVRCAIDRSDDRYHVNDTATKVFRFGL